MHRTGKPLMKCVDVFLTLSLNRGGLMFRESDCEGIKLAGL
jgi:hypothetical protein